MDVVLEDNMEIDLSAILRGDVNASYEADTHDVAPTTQQPSPRIFSDIQSPQQEDILITQWMWFKAGKVSFMDMLWISVKRLV